MRSSILLTVLLRAALTLAKDDLGKLPTLGWNSWNAFRCEISEEKILTAANALVDLGLKDLGYEYVNLDDCYHVKGKRDENDRMIPDPDKFPNGIKHVADKVHELGLKIGIYSSAGTETCAGYPASLEKEETDVATWAEWGIDFLKYDNCNIPEDWVDEYNYCVPENGNAENPNGTCPGLENQAPEGYDWTTSKTFERYSRMRDAINAQDRPILLSLCNWGHADVTSWGSKMAPLWRMSNDIFPNWPRVAQIFNLNSFKLDSVDFHGHNDADMLEIGNGELTIQEQRTHFAMWAAMKSPLFIGTALDELEDEELSILKNKVLLSFNQDAEIGRPAFPYKWGYNPDNTFDAEHPAEYWSGAFKEGTLVLMLNSEGEKKTRTAVWSEIPELSEKQERRRFERVKRQATKFQVTDVWTGKDLGCIENEYAVELESHDTAVLHVHGPC